MTLNSEKLRIEEVTFDNKSEYENYIFSRPDTTFTDTWAWREVVEKVYQLPHYWFMVKNGSHVEGVLALTLSNHPLFGKYLCTAPFANQGGFYSDSENASHLLLEKANELQEEKGTKYLLIRQLDQNKKSPDRWSQDSSYATYSLPLCSDPLILFNEHLRFKSRNKVSKAIKNGFKVKFGRLELLDIFWDLISYSMKELGSPYHSKYYLKTLLETLSEKSELVILFDKNNKPAGGSLLIYHKNNAIQLHSNCLREYRHLCPGEFLYWSVISECCVRGLKSLDLGRSLVGSGNEQFKMKWRPERYPLAYWYKLAPGTKLPKVNQDNPKYRPLIKTWQRMPLWLLRSLGPRLIYGIL